MRLIDEATDLIDSTDTAYFQLEIIGANSIRVLLQFFFLDQLMEGIISSRNVRHTLSDKISPCG